MTTGWMRVGQPKRRSSIAEGVARSAWLIFFLLLASAAHAQSFTLSLKSCATVPPSASTFTASDGSLVWWNLWNSAPWTGCQITVPTAGTYTVTGKASSPYSTSFHFAMAGANIGTLAIPATAGWGAYETVSAKLNLPAGAVILSFVRDALPANIYDLLTFTFVAPPAPPAPPPIFQNMAILGGVRYCTLCDKSAGDDTITGLNLLAGLKVIITQLDANGKGIGSVSMFMDAGANLNGSDNFTMNASFPLRFTVGVFMPDGTPVQSLAQNIDVDPIHLQGQSSFHIFIRLDLAKPIVVRGVDWWTGS